MKDRYKHEMERFGPRQEELERLYTMIEGGTDMKWKKWLGRRAVAAIAVCAALTLTAAASAVPAAWGALQKHLGAFGPYAQVIEGAVCSDQGIEIQVLSAVSDDLEARFYLAVRDLEGDRLNQFLSLKGRLTAGEESGERPVVSSGMFSTWSFELISYDSETKTALLSARIFYEDFTRPNGEGELSVTGMTTRQVKLWGSVSCASVTGETLKSLPVGKDDEVIFRPGDLGNSGYTDDVLPSRRVVLAPGQTPMPLKGTEDMRISSMGFASDGCFHIRLELDEGVKPGRYEEGRSALLCGLRGGSDDSRYLVYQQTLVQGGLDILFPLIKAEDLEALQSCEAGISGTYFRPGVELEGSWSTRFQMEHYQSEPLAWTGMAEGRQVREVTISPLSVTMYSNDWGGFHDTTLYAVKRDGSAVAAQPGPGRYRPVNNGVDAFNTWRFEEPVEVEEIVSLTLGDTVIPVK